MDTPCGDLDPDSHSGAAGCPLGDASRSLDVPSVSMKVPTLDRLLSGRSLGSDSRWMRRTVGTREFREIAGGSIRALCGWSCYNGRILLGKPSRGWPGGLRAVSMSEHEIIRCQVLQTGPPPECEQRGIISEQALQPPMPRSRRRHVGACHPHSVALDVPDSPPGFLDSQPVPPRVTDWSGRWQHFTLRICATHLPGPAPHRLTRSGSIRLPRSRIHPYGK